MTIHPTPPDTSARIAADTATRLVSAATLGREVLRTRTPAWTLWLGYLSLGGTLSYTQVDKALAGARLVTASDLYLLQQARNC